MLTARRGTTLVELLIAIVMLGVIGAAAAGTLVVQGRVRTRVAARLVAEAELREAVAPLLADLGAIAPALGDIPPGGGLDTMLELRAPVVEGFTCGVTPAPISIDVVLPAARRGRRVQPGDDLWLYGGGAWMVLPITDVRTPDATGPECAPGGFDPGAAVARLSVDSLGAAAAMMPARVTRPRRYSLYRGADGQGWLGLRDWSHAASAFATVQPVAGPFDRSGSRFHYYDSLGVEIPTGQNRERGTAHVEIVLRPAVLRAGSLAPAPPVRVRSAVRNRP